MKRTASTFNTGRLSPLTLNYSTSSMSQSLSDEALTFEPGDGENPRNWPSWKKWSIVLVLIPVDLGVSFQASGFSPASSNFAKEMGVSSVVGTLGLSMTVLGFALGPMVLAPLSEYFGRKPIYLVSYGISLLFLLGTALVRNLGGFLVLRFLTGLMSSVTIANFGGTIADLWEHVDTGIPMSLFLWAATCGSPSGFFLFSFVAGTRPWRDVLWAIMGVCGGFWLLMCAVMRETRHTTILRSRARREIKQNPALKDDPKYTNILAHRGAKELFQIALSRPFRFLFTEAIIIFGAAFNGFLYGISFLFNGAFALVFGAKGHGFTTIEIGLAFLGLVFGITMGPVTNYIWQEKYYQRRIAAAPRHSNIPEARVQSGMVAACAQPVSLFWFAWTTYKSVHPVVPILASALWGWSFYTLILMTYLYTEDSYGFYSASALACLGLVRNSFGGGFPLFADAMFENEGYQWAGSILAFLALVLVPIPFILAKYGPNLRRKSPFASQHMTGYDAARAGSSKGEVEEGAAA